MSYIHLRELLHGLSSPSSLSPNASIFWIFISIFVESFLRFTFSNVNARTIDMKIVINIIFFHLPWYLN